MNDVRTQIVRNIHFTKWKIFSDWNGFKISISLFHRHTKQKWYPVWLLEGCKPLVISSLHILNISYADFFPPAMNTYSYVFNDRYIYYVLYCILYSMLKKKLYIGKHLSHSNRNITVERIMMVNFKKRRRKDTNIASKRTERKSESKRFKISGKST